MLSKGGERKRKDSPRVPSCNLNHGDSKDHGSQGIQKTSCHVPDNITSFGILRFLTYDQA